ncbi:MAG: hypothetical protein M1814_003706 [Vezdaea aestivalis]|nr:MAG: hypothetical protein M1814_003706 [Vezdaea aestivalis]
MARNAQTANAQRRNPTQPGKNRQIVENILYRNDIILDYFRGLADHIDSFAIPTDPLLQAPAEVIVRDIGEILARAIQQSLTRQAPTSYTQQQWMNTPRTQTPTGIAVSIPSTAMSITSTLEPNTPSLTTSTTTGSSEETSSWSEVARRGYNKK